MQRKLAVFIAALSAGLVLLAAGTPLLSARDNEGGKSGRLLKIRVYEHGSETPNVAVNIPMGVIGAFLKLAAKSGAVDSASQGEGIQIGGKEGVRIRGVEIENLWREIEKMEPGQIVEIQDHGDRVDIRVE